MEIDNTKLEEFGITNDGKKKQFCPRCHESRRNKADKSLSVDWDKCIAHCHHCGENFFFGRTDRIGNYQPKALSTMKEKTYHKPTLLKVLSERTSSLGITRSVRSTESWPPQIY